MKMKVLVFSVLAVVSSWAVAGEYVCTVNCVGPSGKTSISVSASSASDAADKVDKQSDQICKAAGHNKSTSSTMSSSQCRQK